MNAIDVIRDVSWCVARTVGTLVGDSGGDRGVLAGHRVATGPAMKTYRTRLLYFLSDGGALEFLQFNMVIAISDIPPVSCDGINE